MLHAERSTSIIEQIKEGSNRLQGLNIEIGKIIVGQKEVINFIINALLCESHLLLEGVPGIAKTTIIKSIAHTLDLHFNRIQFTPDLLPSDLIGTLIYNQKTQDFEIKKGPIFSNIILADEINRAPAKVQSALLESMQEQQVTIGTQTFKLSKPFLVLATQNPIEQEGTYKLPEAQLDRFMFKLTMHYPTQQEEKEIIQRPITPDIVQKVLSKDTLFEVQNLVQKVYVDEKIVDYIINIVFATRMPHKNNLKEIASYILYGVSPRATLALYKASKAHAFLKGRHFVTPDDIKAICPAILRHRLIRSYQAEADEVSTDDIINTILNTIPSP